MRSQGGSCRQCGSASVLLERKESWLKLARSYELTERLTDFTSVRRHAQPPPDLFSRNTTAHAYSLYVYNQDGGLIGPPIRISACSDEAAVVEATKCLGELTAELRDGLRLVKQFVPKQ